MSKPTKRTIIYSIEQKKLDLHKLIVTKGDPKRIEELQDDINYFEYGVKTNLE